jgi:AsmA protein
LVAGITISNAKVTVSDKQAGTLLTLSDANASLTEFEFGQWSKLTFDVTGAQNQQNFAAKGGTEFFLSEDFQDYQLRKLGLDASFSDPENKVEKLRLDLASFAFDKQNALSYELLGDLAGLAVDSKGSLNITVDKAISKIKVAGIERG